MTQRLQAFRYELRPNGEQVQHMRQFAGSCRYVYNRTLAEQKERYEQEQKKLGFCATSKELTAWRNSEDTAWLADAPYASQQQALMDLDRAYTNFFAKRASFPKFKKKGCSRESFRYPDPKAIKLDRDNGRISLPKLGWMRYRNSRPVLGEVRSVTVSERCGRWYMSILVRREVPEPVHPSNTTVGIDVGIANFATFSVGSPPVPPLNSFKKHERRLARAQKKLSRRQKGSKNREKARHRVARIHAHIADARKDFLHKLSHTISKNHAIVCIEDLNVQGMSASAGGTVDAPGCNVRQKSKLNKAILDQGWGEFRRQLAYKCEWRGGHLIAAPAYNTSRTCPSCGHVAAENRKTQALFRCVACGYENHADVVGAINIHTAGLAIFVNNGGTASLEKDLPLDLAESNACGDTSSAVRRSAQEPTEVTHVAGVA